MSEGRDKEKMYSNRYRRYYTWVEPLWKKPAVRGYGLLGLTLITIAFFILFAIKPTINTVTKLNKQIEDDRKVEQKLQEKINNLSQIQTELEVIKSDLVYLDLGLPNKPNVAEIIKSIEKLAGDNSASISAIQIQEVKLSEKESSRSAVSVKVAKETEGKAKIIPLVFTVEGDYASLAKIISQLRKLPRIMAVQSLVMLKNIGRITTTVKVNAYYLPNN